MFGNLEVSIYSGDGQEGEGIAARVEGSKFLLMMPRFSQKRGGESYAHGLAFSSFVSALTC